MLSPTDAPRRKRSEGSQLEDITRKPSILVLLNIPPNPRPAAKMSPVIKPTIMSDLSSFSFSKRTKNIITERQSKTFAVIS